MKKKLLFIILALFAFTPFVKAASTIATQGGITGSSYNVNIPQSVQKYVDEKDVVDVFCYEAKFRGGEAISAVEALHEALETTLVRFTELGVTIDISQYSAYGANLRAKIEAICAATTINTAKMEADNLKSAAFEAKSKLNMNLAVDIKKKIEEEIAREGDKIRASVEEELKNEADLLVNEKKAEYERLIRAEAEAEKEKIKNKLQAEIEAELISEFGSVENPDVAELQKIGKERGMARGEEEKKKVEEKLRAKYEKIAEDEEVKLRAIMEEKGKEKEKELRETYSNLRDVNALIIKLKEAKYKEEWAKYEEMAIKARLLLIKKVVEARFDEAMTLLENEKSLIEEAYKENIEKNYRVPSYDDLVEGLERDKAEVMAMFSSGNTSEDTINKITEKFKEKWEALRDRLETTKVKSSAGVITKIDKSTNWAQLKSSLEKNITHMQTTKDVYAKTFSFCQTDPNAKVNKENPADCARCRIVLKEYKDLLDASVETKIKIEKVLPIIERLDELKTTVPTLSAAVDYKNELTSALNDLKAQENKYIKTQDAYYATLNIEQNNCASL